MIPDEGDLSSAIVNDTYYRLPAADKLLKESATDFKRSGSVTNLRVVTGWIHLDQFKGFERLYRILLLSRQRSAHTLTVRIGYDYEPTYRETFTITSPSPTVVSYEDSEIFGSMEATIKTAYEVEIKPARQKCEVIRLEIFDTPDGSGSSEGLELVGMNLIMGVKNVGAKIRADQRAIGA